MCVIRWNNSLVSSIQRRTLWLQTEMHDAIRVSKRGISLNVIHEPEELRGISNENPRLMFVYSQIKSNQIKSLLLSHHHSTSALVSEILTSVLQTVQKNKTTIYIWTIHIYRLYRRQCAKYTYIYSVHTVYYKDILRYQCTNTHYTTYLHVCIMSTSMHSNMWRCNRL